ncbi:MAG: flagellar hook-associated protein FlgK [Syntrophorhabdaceae bacterium]|nr:flagellar hook-associated protein FlgK [Syntrophorhabdaceae bacterium]
MSLLNIMNIGKSALFTNQAALNVTGHNIANVNTPGYTRQSAVLKVAGPQEFAYGFLGRGVKVAYVRQSYSRFVETQLLGQHQNFGKADVMTDVYSRVEQVFNSFTGSGLSNSLQAFFNSWNALSTDPASFAHRTVLLADANNLIDVAKQMEGNLQKTISEIDKEIQNDTDRINAIAYDIAKLNKDIVRVEAGNSERRANDLRDSRNTLVTELAGLVQLSTLEDTNGSLTVLVGMRDLVSGAYVNEMTSGVDALGNVTIKIDNTEISSRITKGELGGYLESRKAIEEGPLKELRKFAAALTLEVNEIHNRGIGLDGYQGDFFSPLSVSVSTTSVGASVSAATVTNQSDLTLSEYDVTFSGGTWTVKNRDTGATLNPASVTVTGNTIEFEGISITVAGAIANGDTFVVSPLTDAIGKFSMAITNDKQIAAAYDPNSPGDNRNALDMAQLAEQLVGRLGGETFSRTYTKIVSMAGLLSSNSIDMYKFESNLRAELQSQRDAISGVSIDEEAANLLIYQRGFEASARLITVADELIQTVLNL